MERQGNRVLPRQRCWRCSPVVERQMGGIRRHAKLTRRRGTGAWTAVRDWDLRFPSLIFEAGGGLVQGFRSRAWRSTSACSPRLRPGACHILTRPSNHLGPKAVPSPCLGLPGCDSTVRGGLLDAQSGLDPMQAGHRSLRSGQSPLAQSLTFATQIF